MLREVRQLAPEGSTPIDRLTLPFELRQRSRLRARLDGGGEVALLLPRGRVLRGGDLLLASDDSVIEVHAAAEAVSTVTASDARLLTRCAYHLGNRHVPLEVGTGYVRYGRDHVLDAMVETLGGTVQHEHAAFEPEGGAYGGHGHAHEAVAQHDQDHEHEHDHQHEHDHGRRHDHDHDHQHDRDHDHQHDRDHGHQHGHQHDSDPRHRHD